MSYASGYNQDNINIGNDGEGGGGGGGIGIATYGTSFPVIEQVTPFPLTVSGMDTSAARRGDIDTIRNLDTDYDSVRWNVDVAQAGTPVQSFTNQSFTTRTALVAFLNANVPNNGATFTATAIARPYDVVDENQATRLVKIYGKNAFFSRLRRPYWGSVPWVRDVETWAQRNSVLNSIWTACFSAAFGKDPATWDANDLACFWMGSNRHRFYSIPNGLNIWFEPGTGGGRYFRNAATSTDPIAPNTNWSESAGERIYAGINTSGALAASTGPDGFIGQVAGQFQAGISCVVAIPLTNGANRSLYIKPVGVDQIFTNYYNPALFRVEAVGSFFHDSQRRIRVLTPAQPGDASLDMVGPFNIDQWFPVGEPPLGVISGSNSVRPGNIGFQLRNLEDNTVTGIAPGEIHWLFRQRGLPLAAQVKNRVG